MALNSGTLVKLFVRVPASITNFDGATVSASSDKIYFEEATNTIWAKGDGYGISDELKQQIQGLATAVGASTDAITDNTLYGKVGAALSYIGTLQGTDGTSQSIRQIAQDVVDTTLGLGTDDANSYIDRVKEVLDWFANVAETETGQALIQSVADNTTAIGHPTTYYTADDEEVIAGTAQVGDVKSAATGLYAAISDAVAGNVHTASDDVLIHSYMGDNNTVNVYATSSLTDAVSNANNAVQSVTIGTYTLNKTNGTLSTQDLKGLVISDLTGSAYSINNGIRVDVSSLQGEVSSVTVDASELAGRVSTLEQFAPWEEYVAPSGD